MLERWLDCSAYSGPTSLEVARWRKAYAQGVRCVCVQAWGGRPEGMVPNT